jgi:hypothetical protein
LRIPASLSHTWRSGRAWGVTTSATGSTPEADSMADEGGPVGPVAPPVRATIGLAQAVALYLGAILGAGVLILPGVTASEAGPAAILSWTFIAILGLPLALTFARLAKRSPDAGGVAAFARAAFGDAAGAEEQPRRRPTTFRRPRMGTSLQGASTPKTSRRSPAIALPSSAIIRPRTRLRRRSTSSSPPPARPT